MNVESARPPALEVDVIADDACRRVGVCDPCADGATGAPWLAMYTFPAVVITSRPAVLPKATTLTAPAPGAPPEGAAGARTPAMTRPTKRPKMPASARRPASCAAFASH